MRWSRWIAAGSLLLALAFSACGDDGGVAGGQDGGSGGSSTDGAAASSGSAGAAPDGGWPEGGGCTPQTCTLPGHACIAGACVADCRVANATACAAGTLCNVGSDQPGQCTAPGAGCVVSSEPQACGSLSCGPGTRCDGAGGCYPALPCSSLQCDSGVCWGTDCPCTRPTASCAPAPLGAAGDPGTLNDFAFSRCGTLASCDGGIVDLDFDQACNAYGVTVISGTDYLRKITPAGVVSEYAGVTNLNMGEVAAIQGASGVFGGGLLDVALTYICCQSCGCILGAGGDPQGVAQLDAASGSLPMKIPTTQYTTGSGPFGLPALDTGPYGLSWGLDRVLYVGNVAANGDYHALDLSQQTSQQVADLGQRVHASAPFDKLYMLVALESGEVRLVPALGAAVPAKTLITLPAQVTSIVRDPWSGRVYAELADQSIVSFAEDGTDQQPFQTAPGQGRITIAPDGKLYHLTRGFPAASSQALIVSWALPSTL